LPLPANRRFDAANDELRRVIDEIIAQYRSEGLDHGDLVSMLLEARDEETGEGLSDTEIRDEVVTMYAAGFETVSNSMGFSWHVICRNPDVEAKLYEEVDRVLGDGGPVTFEAVGKLEYTRRVFTEVLRMYTPAWFLTRRAEEDLDLDGVKVPAGTQLFFSLYALQRDEEFFPNPDVFDPDRWLPERAKEVPRWAFNPFGMGNRQCIGEPFAWAEGVVILATMAARRRFKLANDEPMGELAFAALRPTQLAVTVEERT
ncbi:MAG: cytochrome P450, partial [Corynebacteriales bacterium]|nr:cytochrome P450 [Mycobacteriales bacterium]